MPSSSGGTCIAPLFYETVKVQIGRPDHHSTLQSQTIVPKDTIISLARRQCSKKSTTRAQSECDDGLRRLAESTWLALEIIVAERVTGAPRFLIGFGVACPYSANMGTSVNWRKNGSI